mgnify:CR=1 FL=1
MHENIFHRKITFPIYDIFTPYHNDLEYPTAFSRSFIKKDNLNPDFVSWIDSLGLEVSEYSELFFSPKNKQYGLHKDLGIDSENDSRYNQHCVKLNIIYNGQNSKMKWFALKNGFDITNGVLPELCAVSPTNIYDEDKCVVIHEASTDGPAELCNTIIIHTLQSGDNDRWCYSFVLHKKDTGERVSWNEALDVFKDITEDVHS